MDSLPNFLTHGAPLRARELRYNCIVFTDFHHTKLYPFQNLSLALILKIFLKFRVDILLKYILFVSSLVQTLLFKIVCFSFTQKRLLAC